MIVSMRKWNETISVIENQVKISNTNRKEE